MQKVIVLDGPDGCGKTTIAKELARRLDIPYFKNTRQKMFFERDPGYFVRAMKYGDPYFGDYLKQTGASVILDRAYPSEWVYSQAFGRQTDERMLRLVDEMYADIGLKIVSPFRSDYSKVVDQFAAIDKRKLETIHELYAQFCSWTKCDVIRFCVDDENIETQMNLIIPFVGGAEMIDVDERSFDNTVLESETPVLVDFWAPWCAPCRALSPILERIAKDYFGRVSVVKVNIDENQGIAERFSIRSIPTLMVFKGGKLIDSNVGMFPENKIREMLDRAVA